MTPATPRFLASRCPACGAAKSRPSPTAYVYCDYCGALADYDFRKACEIPQKMPGPAYAALCGKLKPRAEAAQAAGDRDGYLAVQRTLFDAWVEHCPQAVPPRCSDAAYRRAYVAQLAGAAAFAAFDERARALGAAVDLATAGLKWITRGTRVSVGSESFSAMADAVMAQLDYLQSEAVLSQLPPMPDGAPAELQKRMTLAMFVQGWLPYLAEDDARRLLAATGLEQVYVTAVAADGDRAACGHCRAPVTVLAGAKRAVCDGCGRRLQVGARIDCRGCGHPLCLDDGSDTVGCPFCQARIERVAIPWPPGIVPGA